MSEQYFIGIDIGSSFTKSSVIDTGGNVLAHASRDTHPSQPRPGVAEYDGPAQLAAVYDSINELLEKSGVSAGDVAAICLDGMQSGTMGIDAEGNPTTPYTTTLDLRFNPYLDQTLDRFHDPIRRLTGSGQPTIAPKMLWIREEFPDIYRATAKFVTISGYLLGKMAGFSADEAFVDYTYLWVTGLSDTQHYAWSDELCSLLDLSEALLPRIVKSSDIIGSVCTEAAEATGLLAGTPIVAGATDQATGFIGAGITKANRMASNAGTYPLLAVCTDQFHPDMSYRMVEVLPSAIPGLWNPVSYIIGGGLSHHWFMETFALADAIAAEELGEGVTAYEVLDEKAGDLPPGSEKLFFLPHLGGRSCPANTSLKGGWFGFSWTHQREHFYRAILEGVAYEQYLEYKAFRATNPEMEVSEVIAYGGGTQSALWNQIKADVIGVPHVLLDKHDLSPLGNAILAGYALGIYDDIAETAERFVRRTTRFEPRPENHEFYLAYAAFYEDLLAQTSASFSELADLPAWEN